MKRKYFDSKREALDDLRNGDRLYYDAFRQKYYIVNFKTKFRFLKRRINSSY